MDTLSTASTPRFAARKRNTRENIRLPNPYYDSANVGFAGRFIKPRTGEDSGTRDFSPGRSFPRFFLTIQASAEITVKVHDTGSWRLISTTRPVAISDSSGSCASVGAIPDPPKAPAKQGSSRIDFLNAAIDAIMIQINAIGNPR